jgi:hypothetical protein
VLPHRTFDQCAALAVEHGRLDRGRDTIRLGGALEAGNQRAQLTGKLAGLLQCDADAVAVARGAASGAANLARAALLRALNDGLVDPTTAWPWPEVTRGEATRAVAGEALIRLSLIRLSVTQGRSTRGRCQRS